MVSCLYCVHPEKWFFTTLLEYRWSYLCRIFLSLAFLFSAFMLALPPASAQVTSAEPEAEMLQTEQVQEEGVQDEMTPDMDLLLREVIFKHPQIAAASARSCRANYSLNIAKARNRPQITGSLEGNSALLSSVDYNDDTEKGRQLRGRAFNKPAYDNAVDVVFSLDKVLWDAGKLNFDISAEEFGYRADVLRREEAVSQLVLDLIGNAANLEYAARRVQHYQTLLKEMAPFVETVEARVEAGVARIELLRQVKITVLDAEFQLRTAENDLRLAEQNVNNQFQISQLDAQQILNFYIQSRTTDITPGNAEEARLVRIYDLEAQRAAAQNQSVSAEVKPQLTLRIDTRLFDVSALGQNYEVIGNIGFRMPLYDGGLNNARKQQTAQSVRESLSQRREEVRNINNEYQRYRKLYTDSIKAREQLSDRFATQKERISSLLTIADRADISILELIRLQSELTSTTVQLERINLDNEILFARRMHLTDQLLPSLGLGKREITC